MPPTRSNAGGQAEMMTLLRKISEDNEKLHSEMRSLREETFRVQLNLQTSVDKALDKALTRLKKSITTHLENMQSSLAQGISDSVADELRDVDSNLERTISDGLDNLEQNLAQSISDSVADELRNVDSNLESSISNELDNLQQGLADNITENISNELEGLQQNLEKVILGKFDEESKIVRSKIASVRRVLDASRSTQDRMRRQDEFILFPRLPPELRTRIWKMACFNDPCVFKLHVTFKDEFQDMCFSGYRSPAVLQISQESRWEALKWYKCLHYEDCYGVLRAKYFNFGIDILYLVTDKNWDIAFDQCWVEIVTKCYPFRKFHRVAVSESIDGWLGNATFLSKPRSKIEEILLVTNHYDLSETSQRLVPLGPDHQIPFISGDNLPLSITVERQIEIVYRFLNETELDEDDGSIVKEEVLSDDETPVPFERHGVQVVQLRKPWPKITYATLKDAYPVPTARILST